MFPPIFDGDNKDSRSSAKLALIIGAGVALFLGAILFFLRAGSSSPMMLGLILALLVGMILVLASVFTLAQRRDAQEKLKRSGQDMYTLIDRMVDELDEDELAYLRSRLEQRERAPHPDLAASVEELLDQRDEAKRAGRR